MKKMPNLRPEYLSLVKEGIEFDKKSIQFYTDGLKTWKDKLRQDEKRLLKLQERYTTQ